jgi:low temperature requirement protein LtrA
MTLRWAQSAAAAPEEGRPVSTLELFFDLVFVFTITQVTALVRDGVGAAGYLRGAAVLVVTWWMYDGYAWLSNNIEPTTLSTRLPMLMGMAGFLIMAIATPQAFGSQAWAFAVAYLLVVLVHSAQFTRSSLGTSSEAIRRIVPVNLTTALMLVLAAALGGHLAWIGWSLAIVPLIFAVVVRRERGFAVRAGHFAERHQLIIIIALGETVVAVGAGAQDRLHSFPVVVAVLLSLALLSAVWWLYFGGDDERAAEMLAQLPETEAPSVALRAYSLAHLLHVAGLVLVAVGLHAVVAAPADGLSARNAVTTGAGIALFMVGELCFLRTLRLSAGWALAGGAAAALVVSPIGLANGLAELALLTAVTIAVVRWGRTAEMDQSARAVQT